jgi:hypothetical protein
MSSEILKMEDMIMNLVMEIIAMPQLDDNEAVPYDKIILDLLECMVPYHAQIMAMSEARQISVSAREEEARQAQIDHTALAAGVGSRARTLQAKAVDALKPKVLVHDDNLSTL